MKHYQLKNYEDQLNHQVIHMDQAVCYNPEFRATHMMHDYPSRKLQLARAMFKGELKTNDYIAALMYNGILSRQGERWQNFGENPEDCTDVIILCREMFAKKGYAEAYKAELEADLKQNGDHIYPVDDVYEKAIPVDSNSNIYVLVDDMTAAFAPDSSQALADYFKTYNIASKAPAKVTFLGFEYFSLGLIDQGIEHLKRVIEKIETTGAKKILVLSAQAKWILTTFAGKVDLSPRFEVIYLPEILTKLEIMNPAYVYAGSFNLRYLVNADLINRITANTREIKIAMSPEFTPLLKGDRRINQLTIWQKPLGPEFRIFGMNRDLLTAIKEDAIADIQRAQPESILVFEATALPTIQASFPSLPVYYYLDLL
jgi:tetratricopeptide (TPR) repeat protein